jgi:hypothetical protein
MDLHDMHIWFRQYAQQMGMQNVRAILPEQIDLLINTSISDIVNQLIRENIGITNDRVITDNSKIGQINAFKTLYKVVELQIYNDSDEEYNSYLYMDGKDKKIGKLSNKFNIDNNDITGVKQMPDYLFLVDFSINYRKASVGYNNGSSVSSGTTTYTFRSQEEAKAAGDTANDPMYNSGESVLSGDVTNYFPVRIIDDAYLADTLNDFVLKPRVRTPIIVVHSGTLINNVFVSTYDLYIDKFSPINNGSYTLSEGLIPYMLRMAYIAKPAKVKYLEDLTGNANNNINCDLPESMHIDILKHAVDLYRTSVSGALYATQQREDNNAREAQRNNYRNENN